MYTDGAVVFITTHFSMFVISNVRTAFADLGTLPSAGLADVRFTSARGIFVGKSATRFDPHARITQAEFLAVLSRLADANLKEGAVWYEVYLKWAEDFGIVKAADVSPDAALERADMALWLYRLILASNYRLEVVNRVPAFTDIDGLSREHVRAIESLYRWGIIEGSRPGVEFGDRVSERFQISHIITRLIKSLF
jgi:hypothetical protein